MHIYSSIQVEDIELKKLWLSTKPNWNKTQPIIQLSMD